MVIVPRSRRDDIAAQVQAGSTGDLEDGFNRAKGKATAKGVCARLGEHAATGQRQGVAGGAGHRQARRVAEGQPVNRDGGRQRVR